MRHGQRMEVELGQLLPNYQHPSPAYQAHQEPSGKQASSQNSCQPMCQEQPELLV
jgi:hypothetical protein